jgi:hypothetical protein
MQRFSILILAFCALFPAQSLAADRAVVEARARGGIGR